MSGSATSQTSFEGLEDLARRLSNLVRVGTISAVDYPSAKVKVAYGKDAKGDDLVTGWLPWITARASHDITWHAPELAEQVMVISPSGELKLGIVLPALFQSNHPALANDASKHVTKYKDGTIVEYDRENHHMKIDCVGSVEINGATNLSVNFDGSIEVTAPSTTINTEQLHNGDLTINGNLNVSGLTTTGGLVSQGTVGGGASIAGSVTVTGGDPTADGISLKSHTHQGDSGGTTSQPQ